jgi:hydrogenase/urease accessory protein HupE
MALPTTARAHLNSTGMGPIYDGVLHLVLSPEDMVPVLGLALLAGLRGAPQARRALFVLPAAWLLGGIAGVTASATEGSPFVSAAWFLLLGGLIAADARLPQAAIVALAALLGLTRGWLNGSGMGEIGGAAVALVGLTTTVFVLVALGSALVVSIQANWARIAVRVAGSWIAASGLLLLGWATRAR